MNKATRLLLVSLVICEAAIATYITVSREDNFSRNEPVVERDLASTSQTIEDSPDRSVGSGPDYPSASPSADITQLLHAVRNSLEHNDLVSAKVLLDAVDPLHDGDEQVLTLRKTLRTREEDAAGAMPAARVEKLPELRGPTYPKVRPSAKIDHVRNDSMRGREYASDLPHHFGGTSAPNIMDPPDKSVRDLAVSGAHYSQRRLAPARHYEPNRLTQYSRTYPARRPYR